MAKKACHLIHDGHFGSASDAEAWKCRRCASSRLSASTRRGRGRSAANIGNETWWSCKSFGHFRKMSWISMVWCTNLLITCLLDPFTMPWCDFPWPFPPKHVARMGRDSIGYSGNDVPCYVYIMVWRTLQCSLHGGAKFPLGATNNPWKSSDIT